jgi:hypothetical protein
VAFNPAFSDLGSAFLQNYLQGGQAGVPADNEFAYSPQDSFSIAGTTPKNKYYSMKESQEFRDQDSRDFAKRNNIPNQNPGLTPLQQVRYGLDDAIVNTGNAFGQDWSGVMGEGGGSYRRPEQITPQERQRWANYKR